MRKIPSKKAFVKLPHRLLDSNRYRRLSLAARAMYIALARLHSWHCHAKEGATFEFRDWQMENELAIAHGLIVNARKELVDEGFIEVSRASKRKPTKYLVRYPVE